MVKINAYDCRKNGMRLKEAIEISRLLEKAGCSAIEVSCGVAEDGLVTMRSPKLPVKAVFKYTYKYNSLPWIIKKIAGPVIQLTNKSVKPLTNYNVNEAKAIKDQVSIPVIAVGGIDSINDIRDIIDNNKADYVSMSRPFILEPNIVNKFKDGKQEASRCIKCNYCIIAIEEEPLKCYYGKLKKA